MEYKYTVYIYNEKGYLDCKDIKTDTELADFVCLLHMNSEQEITTDGAKYMGESVAIEIVPYLCAGMLAFNTQSHQFRIIRSVCDDKISVWNTDDSYKADLQKNGYIPARYEVWNRDQVIPLSLDYMNACDIYYRESGLGKDKDFNKMEMEGMMDL